MKKTLLFAGMVFLCSALFAQEDIYNINRITTTEVIPDDFEEKRSAFTIGFLKGGGGLVGLNFETLVNDKIAIQGGIGLFSVGAAINFHKTPNDISSSFFSIGYWNQGISGDSFYQSMIGPSYVFRAKKHLEASLGLGIQIKTGPLYEELDMEPTPVMLLYSLGIYFLR
jgi:hypothetical protein